MAAGPPDAAVPTNADRIREARFDTVKRGYDPSQVLQYLGRIADRFHILEERVRQQAAELAEISRRAEVAVPDRSPEDPYDAISQHVAEVLKGLDEEVARAYRAAEDEAKRIVAEAQYEAERIGKGLETLRREARSEAERIVSEARAEAERIRVDAQAVADAVRSSAERSREEAALRVDRAVAELEARRDALRRELGTTRERVLRWLHQLQDVPELEHAEGEVVVLEDLDTDRPSSAPAGPTDGPP
ncbi:MAG: DivIVA domain-containing protein [Candidatus Velamenicoccus archaeovorus]